MKVTLKSSQRLYDIMNMKPSFYCKKKCSMIYWILLHKAEEGFIKLNQCQVNNSWLEVTYYIYPWEYPLQIDICSPFKLEMKSLFFLHFFQNALKIAIVLDIIKGTVILTPMYVNVMTALYQVKMDVWVCCHSKKEYICKIDNSRQ